MELEYERGILRVKTRVWMRPPEIAQLTRLLKNLPPDVKSIVVCFELGNAPEVATLLESLKARVEVSTPTGSIIATPQGILTKALRLIRVVREKFDLKSYPSEVKAGLRGVVRQILKELERLLEDLS